jgi:hypothetical protein
MMIGGKGNPIMQMRQFATGIGGHEVAIEPDTQRRDFVNPDPDEILALLKSGGDRKRTIILVGGALLVGLGLGWTAANNSAAFNTVTQVETPRRLPEIKPGGKSDSVRKTSSVSSAGAPLAKAEGTSPAGARLSSDAAGPSLATPANAPPAARELVAVPETKPTTIAGWTVLEVRGGTVVLDGPDGVRTAARGDIVPGIGRIDSIVRWGNRWIVATASGLIADQ